MLYHTEEQIQEQYTYNSPVLHAVLTLYALIYREREHTAFIQHVILENYIYLVLVFALIYR